MVLKKWSVFFLLTILFFACTQKEDNTRPVSASPIKMLQDSIAKYPDSLPLRVKLIQLYSDSNDFKNAIRTTNEALARDTSNPDLWDIRASVQYQYNDTLGAIKSFEKAISIIPLPDYLISVGSLYAQTKNPLALNVAEELLGDKNAKAEKEAYFIKGLYYSYAGDKLQAIKFFDKCISMDYTYMFAYREKGIAYYDLGRYNEAIAVLTRAVTIQNSFDEGYYWLGRCDEKINNIPEAINNYKTALLYDKDFIEAHEALNKLQPK